MSEPSKNGTGNIPLAEWIARMEQRLAAAEERIAALEQRCDIKVHDGGNYGHSYSWCTVHPSGDPQCKLNATAKARFAT